MLAWLNFYFVPLATKICLVGMFPVSGYDKIVHWDAAMGQAKTSPVPGPAVLLALGIAVELLTPVCIVLGWHGRLAAFILAGFCVVTAVMYHPFWKFGNFWNPDDLVGRSHFWDFLKNFGLAGGLGLVLIGGAPVTASAVLTHPLSDTPSIVTQLP
jgi:putative oxidoreductase